MLSMLALTPSDKVLEIGTGSGFQTRFIAESGAEVHSVELEPWLTEVSNEGSTSVYLHQGDGKQGLAHEQPFTAIMATCGVEFIPQAWIDQLAEKGRLVAPVGDVKCQSLVLFHKQAGELIPKRTAAAVKFQMLREPPAPKPIPYQAKGHALDCLGLRSCTNGRRAI